MSDLSYPNISTFINKISGHKNPSKSERLNTYIFLPLGLQSTLGTLVTDIPFQCEGSELPGTTFSTVDYRSYGPVKSVPNQILFGEITLTFICTNDFWEKPFFDAWFDYINPRLNGYDFRYKDDFIGTIYCNKYDLANTIIYQAGLQKAYPISIAPLPAHWGDDSYDRLQVTFKYDRFLIDAEFNQIVQTISNILPIEDSPLPLLQTGSVSIDNIQIQ